MARILIIDDETNIRMMMRMALKHVRHEVVVAADGQEGLDEFRNGKEWDVVLLDQRMPGMEGLQVLREIRRRDPEARVIMITAFGTIDLAVDAMKAGAMDFLRKPFTAEVLRGAVKAALEGPAEGVDEPEHPRTTYGSATLNGFRIEYSVEDREQTGTESRFTFTVRSPQEESRRCVVVLPAFVRELVMAHLDREELPGGERFWQAFCEEALANYLWQHAAVPEDDAMRLDDLSGPQKRWAEMVLSSGAVTC